MNKIYDDNGISLYLIRYGLKTRAGITAKKKKKKKSLNLYHYQDS